MQERKKTLFYGVIILAVGLCYYIFVQVSGFGIPCVFHLLTGLKCPGCGITAMFSHLLKGDFSLAFKSNPCIFILLPVWLGCIAVRFVFLPECLSKNGKVTQWITISSVVILLIFGILRNIF